MRRPVCRIVRQFCRAILAFEDRTEFPDAETADTEVLAESQLHEEHRDPGEEEREEIGHEEGA